MMLWSGAWLRWHRQDKEAAVFLAEGDIERHEARRKRPASKRSAPWSVNNSALRHAQNSQVKLIHETLESGSAGVAATMLRDPSARPRPAGTDGFAWNYVREPVPARNDPSAPAPASTGWRS